MSTPIDKAKDWTNRSDDSFGNDKKVFLKFLLNNCVGYKNSRKIDSILDALKNKFEKPYSRELLQRNLLVPLREEIGFFVGTSSKGIYLVKDANDALATINFYTKRIRSEEKHLRNLKVIVQRNKLFRGFTAGNKLTRPVNVYFDESGTPDINTYKDDPFFIVTGVILDTRSPYQLLRKKIEFLRELLKKPIDYEFKSNKLNNKEHTLVLKELRSVDYEFASVCFEKEKLNTPGFKHASSFYKYANHFLVNKLLDKVGKVRLFFDQYGDPNTEFEKEFLSYIKSKIDVWPEDKIEQMKMLDSQSSIYIQTADLIAGAVSKSIRGKGNFMPLLEEKKIEIYWFPYR